MLCVIPLVIVGGVFQSQVLSRNIARNKKALENAGMVAVDSIENVRTVAVLGVEGNFFRQYSTRIEVMYRCVSLLFVETNTLSLLQYLVYVSNYV